MTIIFKQVLVFRTLDAAATRRAGVAAVRPLPAPGALHCYLPTLQLEAAGAGGAVQNTVSKYPTNLELFLNLIRNNLVQPN